MFISPCGSAINWRFVQGVNLPLPEGIRHGGRGKGVRRPVNKKWNVSSVDGAVGEVSRSMRCRTIKECANNMRPFIISFHNVM